MSNCVKNGANKPISKESVVVAKISPRHVIRYGIYSQRTCCSLLWIFERCSSNSDMPI